MTCDNLPDKEGKMAPLPEGVPPLSSLYLYLSGSCNLACRHCWIAPEFTNQREKSKNLPFKFVESAIKQGKPLGLRSVKLTGGEPLLHPQFKNIIQLIVDEELFCPIETNGTLIDEELAEFIASYKNSLFVSISLDGSNAETHERLRGVEGSFTASVDGIRYLVKNNLHPQIICTLHKGNKDELEDVVRMADEIGCGSIKFNLLQAMGRGDGFKKEFGFTVPETLELYQFVEEKITQQYKTSIFFDIPQAFFPLKRFLQNNCGRCNVLNILGVLHTGELSLCGVGTSVHELVYGHLEKDELKDVWIKSPGLQELRDNVPSNLLGICYNCLHKNACLGACIANSYVRTGKINSCYSFCEQADRLGLFPKSRRK